jgi:hypothetical protein
MVDNHDLLKCPLCDGHGEVRRARLLEYARNPRLVNGLEDCLSAGAEATSDRPELQEVGAGSRTQRDFQKEVHSWNPQLSIWRRSPKE